MTDDAPLHRRRALDEASTQYAVNPEDTGARLDKWLSAQIAAGVGGLSRSRLKALIEAGAVFRNGTPENDPAAALKAGDVIRVDLPPLEPAAPAGEDIALVVLYEDDDLIVIDKPAGMTVHPAPGAPSGTLVNALIAHCGASLSGVGGVARPGIVHRLDKDTSGVIVVAKHDAAHRALSADFSVHAIERRYLAIAHGAPRPAVGAIDAPMTRLKSDRRKMTVAREEWAAPGVRPALTRYKTLAAYGRGRAKLPGDAVATLLECELETGRTHQIRVHLAHIGHPLVGDPVYGRTGLSGLRPGDKAADRALEAVRGFRRQALHAAVLGFDHPVSGEPLRFETPPPADFEGLKMALAGL